MTEGNAEPRPADPWPAAPAVPVSSITEPRPPSRPLPPSIPSSGWSPLGATPSGPPAPSSTPTSPPVQARAAVGVPQFLPPVAPPGEEGATTDEPAEPASPRSRWGWRALVAFLAGGLVAAAGFGAARLELEPGTDNPATTEAAASATSTTRPPIRTAERAEVTPPDSDVEPAAYVAQVLGPAVVQLETRSGLGSGVIYDDDLVLTNNHVIDGATTVAVTLSTGQVLRGEVVGTDTNTDVAVIRVSSDEPLPKAVLATGRKAQVGQLAVAIGSPFDLQQSVTAGIVSAVDRPIQNGEQSVVAMIQTDAPINPGNSGGALADRFGRVIGINTLIQTDGFTTANIGVGFAIPIDTAIRIADLLTAGQPIEPGFLGVRGTPPPGGEAGVTLTEVTAGSAAEDAGLLVGDRVLSFNGAPITEFVELAGLVLANQAGDAVVLEVVRDGELIEVEAELGLRPDG
jgi:S1-C subfamily serine protease